MLSEEDILSSRVTIRKETLQMKDKIDNKALLQRASEILVGINVGDYYKQHHFTIEELIDFVNPKNTEPKTIDELTQEDKDKMIARYIAELFFNDRYRLKDKIKYKMNESQKKFVVLVYNYIILRKLDYFQDILNQE